MSKPQYRNRTRLTARKTPSRPSTRFDQFVIAITTTSSRPRDQSCGGSMPSRQVNKRPIHSGDNEGTTMTNIRARRLAWPVSSAALALSLVVLAGSGQFATSRAAPANGGAMADTIAASRAVAEVGLTCTWTCAQYGTGHYGPRCIKYVQNCPRPPAPAKRQKL